MKSQWHERSKYTKNLCSGLSPSDSLPFQDFFFQRFPCMRPSKSKGWKSKKHQQIGYSRCRIWSDLATCNWMWLLLLLDFFSRGEVFGKCEKPNDPMYLPGTPNNQFKMHVWWFPTISYIKVWNHPIETTIYKWLALGFQVYIVFLVFRDDSFFSLAIVGVASEKSLMKNGLPGIRTNTSKINPKTTTLKLLWVLLFFKNPMRNFD